MKRDYKSLGTEKISKLLFIYSVPAIVGMLVNSLYNIVDRIFIGNAVDLGADGLAAITIAYPIMLFTNSVGILFGVGGATLFSIKLGEEKVDEANKVLNNSFLMLLISGLLITLFGQVFMDRLLVFLGASENILPLSKEYMRIIFIGSTFSVITLGMNSFLRAIGKPKIAMVSILISAGLNIILDPIFIFVFNFGMFGAALATIIAQFLSAVWIMSYFLRGKSEYNVTLKDMSPDVSLIGTITSFGLPGFLMQVSNSLLNVILNNNLQTYGGDIAVSAMGIVNTVQILMIMPIIGLNQGVQPIVSYNFGAKKYQRIKDTEKLAITIATAICLIGWIITRIFPEQIVTLFNQESELIEFGRFAILTWFWMVPFVGIQMLGSSFFQAVGKPKVSLFLTLTRQVIFLIPAVIIFARLWGINGLMYAGPVADGVSALVTTVLFINGIRNLSKLQKEANENDNIQKEMN